MVASAADPDVGDDWERWQEDREVPRTVAPAAARARDVVAGVHADDGETAVVAELAWQRGVPLPEAALAPRPPDDPGVVLARVEGAGHGDDDA